MSRILVTGINGQVGFELLRACQPLGHVVGVDRSQLDLSRPLSIRAFLQESRPEIIINPAAYTSVDKAEEEEALAQSINGDSVNEMAKYSKSAGALLVHFSTDYVFDGAKAEPYVEGDRPAPLNAYGRSKLAGEQALALSGCDYLCLRTSWVYAARGRNFLKTMLNLGRQRDELRIVSDQIGTPTSARFLADVTARIVGLAGIERDRGLFRSELLHTVPDGYTSWHGFASAIFDLARSLGFEGLRANLITAIRSADFPTAAKRPANSRLDAGRLKQRFPVFLPDWQAGLRLCMGELR